MTFFDTLLLAQAQSAAQSDAAGGAGQMNSIGSMILWMVILFGFLWFFMIRPQQSEQKRRQSMWDGIKVYDKIVTVGGIHGVVTQVNTEDGTLIVRIDESANVKVRLEISCVALVETDAKEGEKVSK